MDLTIGVIGHNEAATLQRALSMVSSIAAAGDRRVFVNSASTDGSGDVAADSGFECWDTPLGKGNAVREAIMRCETDWLVLLDGDIHDSERNMAAVLAAACRESSASLVLGEFSDKLPGGVLSNTWGIYEPLVEALFPEVAGRCGSKPLTGFRGIRVSDDWGLDAFPPDFGVEAHLNVLAAVHGTGIDLVDLGWYTGIFRYKPYMGLEIGGAILRLAVRLDRLAERRLPDWERWVSSVAEVVATYHGDPDDLDRFRSDLASARARPLPPRK